ncbi:unnamed protein product [Lathyrus sativus]|nr:unnamed protein product [Lathyrus sativus]
MVQGGYKWSIGSDESILVWNQNWLHNRTFLINSWLHIPDVSNMKVADLISNYSKQCNSDLIVPLVDEEAANKIRNTMLFELVQVDKMVWNFEKGGNYSVCSAYHFCIDKVIDTSQLRIDENWDLILKLKIPPKVEKKFLRLCRNCVPTRVHLKNKGVDCPIICSVSNQDQQVIFSITLWSLWKSRNNHIWNHVNSHDTICSRVIHLLQR